MIRKAEILDAQEDRRYGKGNRGSDLPDELRRRQDRLARIREARKEMEPDVMTLDAGYWSEDNAKTCSDQGIDAYIATGRLPHGQPLPPKRGPMPKDADAKSCMTRKLRSKKGSRN